MTLKTKIIPIFFPEEQCPFNCTFCSTKTANGADSEFHSINEMKSNIETALESIEKHYKNCYTEIAFFGGTFTCYKKDIIEKYLKITEQFVEQKKVNGIRISTRPDFFDNEIVNFLKNYSITTVEFGVQSFVDDILTTIKRGHNAEIARKAVKKSIENGYTTSVHLMCGLPGESEEDFMYSILETIKLKPDFVRIHPLVVMKNTQLAKDNFQAKNCNEIIERLAKGVWLLERNGIKVIKLGLQPTDSLNSNENVISGCYHQSLKHLVYSNLFRRLLLKVHKEFGFKSEITVSESDYSYISGYKKMNCDILIKFEKVGRDKNLKSNEIIVNKTKLNIMSEELYGVKKNN